LKLNSSRTSNIENIQFSIPMDIETDFFSTNLFTFKPIHTTKMYYIDREQSYENRPQQLVQKPKDLIQNGFFHTGIGDRVTCFYRDVTLKQWDTTDCIETEHLKWEPNCLFAKMVSSKVPFFNVLGEKGVLKLEPWKF